MEKRSDRYDLIFNPANRCYDLLEFTGFEGETGVLLASISKDLLIELVLGAKDGNLIRINNDTQNNQQNNRPVGESS